jgi:serine/threonine protein phosphatase PrpC
VTGPGTVRVAALTGRGSVRDHNEDAALVFGWLSQVARPQRVEVVSDLTPPLLCAVADGLGGHRAGAVASRLALASIAEDCLLWTNQDAVRAGLQAVSGLVHDVGAQRPDRRGMRTTIAGVLLGVGEAVWFNVGDSRLHQITDGYVEQLSHDDAVIDENGEPTAIVTQTIWDEPEQVAAHVGAVPLPPGRTTRLLLSTDGVWGPVGEPALRRLCREPDLGTLVVSLRDAVYEAGAPDNLTVVALDVTAPDEWPAQPSG